MNQKIIGGIKKHINKLLGPLEDHYYHQYEHALDVKERALYLGKKENLGDEDLELLAITALFHDVGFAIQYDSNEYIGAKMARNYLKGIYYPEDKIMKIETLIMATVPTYQPKNLMEYIIKDADTDNLGREDFFEKGQKLKMEIETIKRIKIKDPEWYHFSLDFLKEHKFYTETEKIERTKKKQENMKKLGKIISK